MKPEWNVPLDKRTLGIAGAVLVVLVVYVWLAYPWGVLGGLLFGGLTGAVVSGGAALFQVLFPRKA